MKWQSHALNNLCTEIRVDLDGRGDEFSALLISDAHWDHPMCRRRDYDRAIDEAVKKNAPIIYNGDTLCLMQSTRDRRATKGKTRDEHDTQDYFREVAVDFARAHERAAANIALIGYGNHETAPLRHCNIDPVVMMADQLERLHGCRPVVGGYRGWVRFVVCRCDRQMASFLMYYFHGAGGGGPVTRGVIQTARRNAFIDGATIIWTGHVHEQWQVNTPVITCTRYGNEEVCDRLHLSTPGFKDEFGSQRGGYHIEQGRPPKPIGGAWLHVRMDDDRAVQRITWT